MKKIILGTTVAAAATLLPLSLVISCGNNEQELYHLNGKTFNNKKDFIAFAKEQLRTTTLTDSKSKLWKISNGDGNQYFSSPQEVREYIFKNKITTETILVPNKYKFNYSDPTYKALNDDEISSFTKSKEGTYYAFRISGGQTILSKPLTNDQAKNKVIFNETKSKVINTFLQIHQIYRFNNLYFPNKEVLHEYLKKNELDDSHINKEKYWEFKVGKTGIKSRLFNFKDSKTSGKDKVQAEKFIQENSEVGFISKDINGKDVFNSLHDVIYKSGFDRAELLKKINYIKVNKTKKRFIIDIEKNTEGDLLGDYLVTSNGQMSRMKNIELEWNETNEKFDMESKQNLKIEKALNSGSDIAFFNEDSDGMDVLGSIAIPSPIAPLSDEMSSKFFNFRNILNSYETSMNKGLGDALWEQQQNLSSGKRFNSFKSLFYLRTWLMDKAIRNHIATPELISLVNSYFNHGIELLNAKLREIILPIAGPEVTKSFDLSKMIDFHKNKNLFIDPEIIMTSFYTGRYKKPGTSVEVYNKNIVVAIKALQVYFAVEGYKAEQTEAIKKSIKSQKKNTNRNFKVELPKYNFENYENTRTESLKALTNTLKNNWRVNSNYSIDKNTISNFKNQVDLYLERTQVQFSVANKVIKSGEKDVKSFNWDIRKMINIVSDLSKLSKKQQIEVSKNNGALMLPTIFPEYISRAKGIFSLVSNSMNNLSALNVKALNQNIHEGIAISKKIKADYDKVKEVIDSLREHRAIVKKVITQFREEFKAIKKGVKAAKDIKSFVKVAKQTIKTVKDVKKAVKVVKEVSNVMKIVEMGPSPWGLVASLAFDLVLDLVVGIIGTPEIDGFKFEYGKGRSENVIWTGGRHTSHEIFGFISWKSGVVNLDDLEVIEPVELTNDYDTKYIYDGKEYENTVDFLNRWLRTLKNKYEMGLLSKDELKDLGIAFKFNSRFDFDLNKLSKEIVDNAKPQTFVLTSDNSLITNKTQIKEQKINSILSVIDPIWVAQLPEIVENYHIKNYENKVFAMPITKSIKLYKHENENIISNNKYLMINTNNITDENQQKKLRILENARKQFEKMFDDYLIKSKHISIKEAVSGKPFDELPDGFELRKVYKAKNGGGNVESFLDIDDAIDWLLVHSNYGTIPNNARKIIYFYKERQFASITEFIESLLKERKKGNKDEKETIYKK